MTINTANDSKLVTTAFMTFVQETGSLVCCASDLGLKVTDLMPKWFHVQSVKSNRVLVFQFDHAQGNEDDGLTAWIFRVCDKGFPTPAPVRTLTIFND